MSEAPLTTAGGDLAPAPPPQMAVNPVSVVNSVVQTVTSHPAVSEADAPSIITSILADLFQAAPAIFAMSRASAKTQSEVGLGLGLAELLVQSFLHPTH